MNGITYRTQDGYRLPNLLPPQEPEVTIGKYGLLRRRFLQEHRRVMFTNLLTSGKLTEHLQEIDRTAHIRLESLMDLLVKQAGVTEELKARDQMAWVGQMNSLKHQAEEMILSELIYA